MPTFTTAMHAAMAALRLTLQKKTPAEAGGAEQGKKLRQSIVPNLLQKVHRAAFIDGLALGLLIGLGLAAAMLLIGGAR